MNLLKKNNINIENIAIFTYFLLTPFEDLLNFGFGTILKYIAAIYILIIIFKYTLTRKKLLSKNNFIILLLFLLLTYFWLSYFWAYIPHVTFDRNITYTLMIIFFIFINLENFTKNEKRILEKVIYFSGLAISIYIIYNFVVVSNFDIYRFTLGEYNDPNNLAALIILPLSFALERIFNKSDYKILDTMGVIIILFGILLTGSRGAFLAIILSFIITMWILRKNIRVKKAITMFVSLGVLTILIYLILPSDLFERLFQLSSYTDDFVRYGSRTDIWLNIYNNILPDLPFLGYGSGNSQYILFNFYNELKATHNTYLTFVIDLGIFGIVLFLMFLYQMFILAWKSKKMSLIFGFISIAIVIFFLDSFPKKYFWNIMFIIIIFSSGKKNEQFN